MATTITKNDTTYTAVALPAGRHSERRFSVRATGSTEALLAGAEVWLTDPEVSDLVGARVRFIDSGDDLTEAIYAEVQF